MAFQNQVMFAKDSVYIHINVENAKDKDAHIAGRVFFLHKPEGHFIEWKAEDVLNLETSNEEWDVIGTVGFRNDREAETVSLNAKMEARRKYNISFDILDLKSFKRSAPNHGWAYIIFILKDGSTFSALHFHNGGSKALLKELEKFIHIRRSPNDPRLFIVNDHDPERLSKSFNELHLFSDSSGALVQNFVKDGGGFPKKFIKDPYTTTLGGFSKVTNFLRDALMTQDNEMIRPSSDVAELLQDDIPGMEISAMDDTGFEVVTKTKLPPRPQIKRGDPLTALQWNSYFDVEGRITNVDQLKDIIFRGGIEPSIRNEVWKFLLDFYSWDSTGKKRSEERKRKVDDYFRMKLQWKTISPEQERRFTFLKDRKGLIDKDVMRTDRTHKFFLGEGNKNLQVLYDILLTYCMYNFDLGYVQGMSDLLSPILVVMENEVDAFWCFAGAMERVCHNFEMDQNGMKVQLAQIHKLMQVYDPELCAYLEAHDSGNFYFCFRWILILFKREFHFHEIQRLWEVIWTGRPCLSFHLIISLAILDTEKLTLIENRFGFTEILKHINDISLCINLEETLCKAEGIFCQLRDFKKLPNQVKEILGLMQMPTSMSLESSLTMSASMSSDSLGPKVDSPQLLAGGAGSVNGTSLLSGAATAAANGTSTNSSLDVLDNDSKIYT